MAPEIDACHTRLSISILAAMARKKDAISKIQTYQKFTTQKVLSQISSQNTQAYRKTDTDPSCREKNMPTQEQSIEKEMRVHGREKGDQSTKSYFSDQGFRTAAGRGHLPRHRPIPSQCRGGPGRGHGLHPKRAAEKGRHCRASGS